jgi:hypothetical protein
MTFAKSRIGIGTREARPRKLNWQPNAIGSLFQGRLKEHLHLIYPPLKEHLSHVATPQHYLGHLIAILRRQVNSGGTCMGTAK